MSNEDPGDEIFGIGLKFYDVCDSVIFKVIPMEAGVPNTF